VHYGVTADTGGHIAYVLDAAAAQAAQPDVIDVTLVTRLFRDDGLDPVHASPHEVIGPRLSIRRIATDDLRYLEKEALAADLPAFAEAFCEWLGSLPELPVVIHAHFADAARIAIEARRRFGIPFVYTPHALGIDKRRDQPDAPGLAERVAAETAAIAQADAIIVSTRDEADRQVSAYGVAGADARIRCLPPGVPHRPAGFAGATVADRLDEWLDQPDRPILLAVARPVRKKNIAALLRAYAACAPLRDRANLVVLAGQHRGLCSGEEAEVLAELRALAALPELRGRVALPPAHDEADVVALYARAAAGGVFVNPALHEPFGLTLLEAAGAGVPVVATRDGGPAEILAEIGHGVLVDPRDEAALAAACLAVVSDATRHARLAAAARSGARRYDWRRYARASTDLYAELAAPALLASDMDGTLTGCAAGALAFGAWRAAGRLPFVIATGRSLSAARTILHGWHLPEPDAWITDVGTRLWLADGAGGWRACPVYAATLDQDWDRAAVLAALTPLGLMPQPDSEQGPHKLSWFATPADAAAARRMLATAGLGARVVFSHGRLLDVLAPHGGKAAAVAAAAARYGATPARCVAAGDSGNDLDMLDACGRAIVVGDDPDLSALPPRPGMVRVRGAHANGVMEGLAAFGLAAAADRVAA